MYWIVNKSELESFGCFETKEMADKCIDFHKKRGSINDYRSKFYGVHYVELADDVNIYDWLLNQYEAMQKKVNNG